MGNSILSALGVRLYLEGQNFKKGLTESKRNLFDFQSAAKNIMGSIGALWSIQKVAAFGKELVDISLKAEGIQRAFDRFADENYLEDLKMATSGAVSELELMTRTVNAKNLGLPIDQLATYFKFATIRAAETGESIDYLINSIVLGIGRRSVKILDNLGISAIRINEEFEKTGDYAQAVGNIIEEEFNNMGDIADLNIQKVGEITAEWENAKKALSEEIQPAMTHYLEEWTTKINAVTDDSLSFGEKLAVVFSNSTTAIYKYNKEVEKQNKLGENAKADYDAKKEIPILKDLATKIELAEAARDASLTEADLSKYNRRIELLKEEVKYYNEIGKAAPKTPNENIKLDTKIELDIGNGEVVRDKLYDDLKRISEQASSEIDSILSGQEDVYKKHLENLNSIIENGFQNAASGLAEGIGELIVSGSFDPSSFLEPFADMAIQLGELAIATGIGITAIKKAFMGNPTAAIIAGIALVALGSAVKASLSDIGSSVGASSSSSATATTDSVSSGTSSTTSNIYDRSRQQTIIIEGTLKGRDIYLSNKNYERTKNLTT